MAEQRELTELDMKIIEKILTGPGARKLAEEFIRKTAQDADKVAREVV